MKTYEPESSFQATDDSSLVYNLRTTGRFRKGQEEWENDVAISIRAPRLTEEQRAEIAELIRTTMNAKYLHNVKVMAHPLAGANVDRGVRVVIRWKHRKQRG